MQTLVRLAPWIAIVAFLVSIAYAIAPGPFTIATFSLVAVPLYALVLIVYVLFVLQDLRSQRVL